MRVAIGDMATGDGVAFAGLAHVSADEMLEVLSSGHQEFSKRRRRPDSTRPRARRIGTVHCSLVRSFPEDTDPLCPCIVGRRGRSIRRSGVESPPCCREYTRRSPGRRSAPAQPPETRRIDTAVWKSSRKWTTIRYGSRRRRFQIAQPSTSENPRNMSARHAMNAGSKMSGNVACCSERKIAGMSTAAQAEPVSSATRAAHNRSTGAAP